MGVCFTQVNGPAQGLVGQTIVFRCLSPCACGARKFMKMAGQEWQAVSLARGGSVFSTLPAWGTLLGRADHTQRTMVCPTGRCCATWTRRLSEAARVVWGA